MTKAIEVNRTAVQHLASDVRTMVEVRKAEAQAQKTTDTYQNTMLENSHKMLKGFQTIVVEALRNK